MTTFRSQGSTPNHSTSAHSPRSAQAMGDPCAQAGVLNVARCWAQTIRQEINRPSLPVREE